MKGKGATRKIEKQSIFTRIDMRLLKPVSIGITVVSTLVAVVLLLLQTANNQVDQFKLNGDLEYITAAIIQGEITPWFPGGYVYLNVDAIQEKLQGMVMISQVSVEKIWPNTLNVKITEERPVAIWNSESMLNENGDVLPLALKELALPRLKGADLESKTVMQHFLLFNRWGKRHKLELVGIEHSSAGWKLNYDSGLKIWLENNTAMSGLQQLESVIKQFNLSRVERIDMRYEQGFAVAWKNTTGQEQG